MRQISFSVGIAVLCGCTAPVPERDTTVGPSLLQTAGIEVADDGRCYARFVSQAATFETVTVQELVVPPVTNANGVVTTPGVFRDVSRDQQVTPAREDRFETPCPPVFTADFNAALQRALQVRGLYAGPISGTYDTATGQAVRQYQAATGPDSEVLSIASGRQLGLVRLSQAQIDALDIQ